MPATITQDTITNARSLELAIRPPRSSSGCRRSSSAAPPPRRICNIDALIALCASSVGEAGVDPFRITHVGNHPNYRPTVPDCACGWVIASGCPPLSTTADDDVVEDVHADQPARVNESS